MYKESLIILTLITIFSATGISWAECDTGQSKNQQCWYECQTDDLCQRVCSIYEEDDTQRLRILFHKYDLNSVQTSDLHILNIAIGSRENQVKWIKL